MSVLSRPALALVVASLFAGTHPGHAQQPQAVAARPAAGTARQFTPADLQGWKTIRNAALSPDGRWFGYVLAPNEGDAEVVLRGTSAGGTEYRFPVGEVPQGGGGGGQTATAAAPLTLSGDGRWAAFLVHPTRADAKKLRQGRRPVQTKIAIVNLATGEKKEFERMRRFAFAGDRPQWIAMHGYPPESAPGSGASGAAGAGASSSRSDAADLILYDLGTGAVVNVGNVGEFGFDESGSFLAYTIDARDRIGNGVQLRHLRTDVVRALDTETALYRRLAWVDSGPAFAVLRGTIDTVAKDTLFTVLTFTNVGSAAQRKVTFDATGRADFPAGMKVSADRSPRIAQDLAAVFFGIREARKPEPRGERTLADGDSARASRALVQAGAPGAGGTLNQPRSDPDDENPSLIIWHAKDPRLQSQQLVQEQNDRSFSYLSTYRLAENRFLRLSDDSVRTVTLLPREQYAYATDVTPYEHAASFNGRRFADGYTIDLRTGKRALALKKTASPFTMPSPDGRQLLLWGEDGHFHVLDVATGTKRNITKDVGTSFVNAQSDINNLFPPPVSPAFANVGWSKDNAFVLLSDGWDIWKVPVRGGAAVNLTGNGRATKTRYQRRYTFDPKEKGIDLAQPLYFSTYGEWTKKEGLARVNGQRGGATQLVADDARLGFMKAKEADLFVLTRQTATQFPDYYVANAAFGPGTRLTDANPQATSFAWSSGVRLVNYVSDKGDTLQAALYLPADYQPGRQYPLLVTIYERRSQNAHQFVNPSETSTPNRTLYTSRGYAVLDPDIVYKINDPGMSAVWAVIPAVKAAIATGVVDSTRIGLWGHSWGGYQTSFLVTQTKLFKAAVAGAPLTDLVSMYSSIYWNTGGTNQAIFESSQGRFTGNFIDNYDAYIRNSPAFHAKNVETPLIIMHNDKDGAVDFNQGITYYNTLRQLGKDVILLEYVGENHGLQRPANQKDYALRMGEWFDHYLRDLPAPDWMVKGVPRLEMEAHLRDRKKLQQARTPAVP